MQQRGFDDTVRGLVRQGDVLLVPVERLPEEGCTRVAPEGGRVVLARGEATGHAHTLADTSAQLYDYLQPKRWASPVRRTYLVVEPGGTLVHEEHDPLALAAGVYEVRRQREYRRWGLGRWTLVAD